MSERQKPFYMDEDQLVAFVERLQANDPTAKEEVFTVFRDKIYGHLVKRAESTEIADELIYEVFAEIFRTVHKLRKPIAFVTWVNRIVEHQVAAYFRKYRRAIKAAQKSEPHQQEQNPENGLEATITDEILSLIPVKQAKAIRMNVIENIPIKVIAQMEEVPEGTIKSRLFYGRKALKEILEQRMKENFREK